MIFLLKRSIIDMILSKKEYDRFWIWIFQRQTKIN